MKILILCTGNSCRSQMAHGFLESFDSNIEVHSAGTFPAALINSTAVKVMAEAGVDISNYYPKNADQYINDEWDYVITVCDDANETCPVFTGKVKHRLHMGYEDPSRKNGTEEYVLSEFRRIRDQIRDEFRKFYGENLKIITMRSDELKQAVKEKYGRIAEQDMEENGCCGSTSCCCSGPDLTIFSDSYENREGYNPDADLNLGCGIPTNFAGIKQGDHVLDLGSGAGNDCFVARALVGETGKVTGLDMTEQMVAKARENCKKLRYGNVEFFLGDIESMPFEDNLFDVVISNCVLNLVPDKSLAFKEIFRVLKPGAHFCVSDVVVKGTLPEKLQTDAEMYVGCVAGASEISEYLKFIDEAGFDNLEVHKQKEIKLPDSVMSEYYDNAETNQPGKELAGIFSITVSGEKRI